MLKLVKSLAKAAEPMVADVKLARFIERMRVVSRSGARLARLLQDDEADLSQPPAAAQRSFPEKPA